MSLAQLAPVRRFRQPSNEHGPSRCKHPTDAARRWHRIRAVRRNRGISLRSVARSWGVDVEEVKRQERASTDLTLSELYRWQAVLDVPVAELLSKKYQSDIWDCLSS